jgi:glycosyltransferase involved in cell wall biosynthesis
MQIGGIKVFNKNFFDTKKDKVLEIKESDIIFVADAYMEDYLGGAEITSERFIEEVANSGKKVCKIRSNELDVKYFEEGINKYWVFFNYSAMNMNLIPTIVANLRYSIVEYDYKFCKYRSTEKHFEIENKQCDCQEQPHGKMVSAFMYGADNLMWMSEGQRNFYFKIFPFLSDKNNFIISSAFSESTLKKLKKNRTNKEKRFEKALILGSNSWIKGSVDAINYCKEKNIEYDILNNVSHDEVLQKMSEYKHFVFLPKGKDTCPRVLIEAKLSGMSVHSNLNCQHINESWWESSSDNIEKYLRDSGKRFLNVVNSTIDKLETISGYTTTKNCIDQKYPYIQAIKSMLGFCDQVVVVDGGSTDGTWESLVKLSKTDDRIIIEQKKRDWDHPRFAVFDGLQKAYARSLCTGDWCWQMDSDEIVHEKDYKKIKSLIKKIPKSMHLLALPVIEYWGSDEKVRIDINPWKWRLSRNHKHITHGIPKQLRMIDSDGNLYARQGTDGCDYIDANSYEIIPCMNFYDKNIHDLRLAALSGNEDDVEKYENWFNNIVENLPGVHHYSWMDLSRKIKTYKNYWSKHWQSLYDITQEDTPKNNMFFDKKWSEVNDNEIKELAEKLKDKMGGWIFHNKVDFDKPTPHVMIERDQPEVMK